MTISMSTWVRKDPQIQVFRVTDLQETYDWLVANLSQDHQISVNLNMGVISFNLDTDYTSLYVGGYVAVDSNGKVFKIDRDLLHSMFDEQPTPAVVE